MKLINKVFLLIGISIGIYFSLIGKIIYTSITDDYAGWMGGVDPNLPLLWLLIAVIGFGFLFIESILALLGLIFIRNSRTMLFLFYVLPGFIGVLISLIVLTCLILFDMEWIKGLIYVLGLIIPSVIYFLYGKKFRVLLKNSNQNKRG